MRSIKALFEGIKSVNPDWSDFICFSEAIAHRKFNKDIIGRAFNKLVPRDDCPDSRVTILRHLVHLTNTEGTPSADGSKDRLRIANIKKSDYAVWRRAVFERDHKICRVCGRNFPLVAHHILEFKKTPELRVDLNNGITLCQECHKKVHHKSLAKPNIYLAENLQKLVLKSPTNDFYTKGHKSHKERVWTKKNTR